MVNLLKVIQIVSEQAGTEPSLINCRAQTFSVDTSTVLRFIDFYTQTDSNYVSYVNYLNN